MLEPLVYLSPCCLLFFFMALMISSGGEGQDASFSLTFLSQCGNLLIERRA